MRNIYLFIVILLIIGCDSKPALLKDIYCSVEQKAKAAEFVLQCAKNSNPMSDEEPEDMLAECSRIAKDLICEKGFIYYVKGEGYLTLPKSCRSAKTIDELFFCSAE